MDNERDSVPIETSHDRDPRTTSRCGVRAQGLRHTEYAYYLLKATTRPAPRSAPSTRRGNEHTARRLSRDDQR